MSMTKSQAHKILSDVCSDYVNSLGKEHPSAARALTAHCNIALSVLTADESQTPVPDEDADVPTG